MRAQGTAWLVLTAAAAGICTTVAGCSSGASAQARAASTLTSRQVLTFADGKALSGSYVGGHLNLAGCAAALPLATFPGGCTFTYHGHVP
jgi:hypothetical protein